MRPFTCISKKSVRAFCFGHEYGFYKTEEKKESIEALNHCVSKKAQEVYRVKMGGKELFLSSLGRF